MHLATLTTKQCTLKYPNDHAGVVGKGNCGLMLGSMQFEPFDIGLQPRDLQEFAYVAVEN